MERDETTESLSDYFGQHLADTDYAIEMLDRLVQSEPPEAAAWFEMLRAEITQDREVLSQLIGQFGGNPTPGKRAGWLGRSDWAARDPTHHPPLDLFLALERLALGVIRKASLWTALQRVASSDSRLAPIPYERLLARADAQHTEIERRRVSLAARALMGRAAA